MIHTIGERTYDTGQLDARTQLNIARRLAPLSLIIQGLTNDENKGKDKTFLVLLMLGQLNDENSDYIVSKCLAAVKVQQKDVWANLVTKSGDLMYEDLGMKTLIDLTAHVIVENLGDFFATALSSIPEEGASKGSQE